MSPSHVMKNLTASASTVLDASGAGTVQLGPGKGGATWHVNGVVIRTNRRGQAPIPSFDVYLDQTDPGGLQGGAYDGSFNQGTTDVTLTRGQQLIAVWTGGQAGDVASMTVTGEQW